MSLKNLVYTFRHWGVNGVGTGVSVVVAQNHNLAFRLLKSYLEGKPNGHTQRSMPDWDLHEESELCGEVVTDTTAGVKLEYWYESEHAPRRLVYIGYGAARLADELDALQAKQNDGRGVTCVRALCAQLRRDDLVGARAIAWNDGDKMRAYPEIVALLRHVGFWYEVL